MGKKDPIPFEQRKRERSGRKASPKKPGKKTSPPARPVPARGGETNDVRLYWSHFFRQPFAVPGRYLWTERMLWGNALIAAILTTVGSSLERGLHLSVIIPAFINAFFVFFLVYYVFPWVADWIFHRMKVHASNVDGLKLDMIVLSGWLVIVTLTRIIPFFSPLPYWTASLLFGVLMLLAVHRRVRSSWREALLATVGGWMAVAVIMIIVSNI